MPHYVVMLAQEIIHSHWWAKNRESHLQNRPDIGFNQHEEQVQEVKEIYTNDNFNIEVQYKKHMINQSIYQNLYSTLQAS